MRHSILAAAALVFALTGAVAANEDARRITVTGQGQVEAVPDMATITMGVTHESKEAGDAMQATSAAVAQMLDRLASLGVEPRDMQTARVSLNPVWSNLTSSGVKTRKITGFVASNTISVRVRDLSSLGTVLDAVIQDGANDFNGLSFSVQDPAPLMAEARKRAVQDAMDKARQLADAAGVELGAVMTLNEHGGGRQMPMAEMARMASDAVPIAAGEIGLSQSVTMVFAITE